MKKHQNPLNFDSVAQGRIRIRTDFKYFLYCGLESTQLIMQPKVCFTSENLKFPHASSFFSSSSSSSGCCIASSSARVWYPRSFPSSLIQSQASLGPAPNGGEGANHREFWISKARSSDIPIYNIAKKIGRTY